MRADRAIRIAIYAVFVAVAVYIGISLYDSAADPLKTVLAAEHTADSTYEVSGWILREETVLSGFGTDVTVQTAEGARIGSGQAFAVRYTGTDTQNLAAELDGLYLRRDQLREVLSGGDNGGDRGANAARQLASAVSRGDLSALDELSLAVSTYVFQTGAADLAELEANLSVLEEDIRLLEAQLEENTVHVYSPHAGLFTAVTDGYEHLGPDSLDGLDPEGLRSLMSGGKISHTDVLGKVVGGNRWYYAVILQEHVAMSLVGQDEYAAEFPGLFSGEVDLSLERVGQAVNGESVVVFSSAEKLGAVLGARQADGSLILRSCTGIRVPRDAVHTDEFGQTFVYILEGLQAKRVDVTLLEEYSGFWYIRTGEELRAGMEIITEAKDLSDGKVVQ